MSGIIGVFTRAWSLLRNGVAGSTLMEIITGADSQRMLEKAVEARNDAVGRLAGHDGSASEREALAGRLFREYSCELLEDLLRVSATGDNSDGASWVRRRHDEQLLELGRQLRDAFPEGEARHAVAQVIQRELLEAERRLKGALKIPAPPAPSHP
jgi:hypothetical protein